MFRFRTRTSWPVLGAIVASMTISAIALPAGASGKTSTFCRDVAGVGTVLSPALPGSDSPSAIASAVSELPADIASLKKIHTKLSSAAGVAPSSALAGTLRVAASSVLKESAALDSVEGDESAVLTDPKSSSSVLALARDLITAVSAAATANAYLTLERPAITAVCRGAA